ncbi:hypothetical protein SAMN05192552_11101 [Natrinema hispanicum]|uniref:Uncharacterized protein n=2 Tax=Natrialbaceae TaxID=1644061 RepID=A0A1G6ZPN3_9EURY|nr:hypothetical protein SAMN05192552_11101 [Natrinema hispanicum]SEU15684.1 hypothetical protein SAMN04488694_1853 [Natrinema hispanicum]SIS22105.1 hypothetical protein SAMN05421752_1502 [Natronorubrum thiooxidans]
MLFSPYFWPVWCASEWGLYYQSSGYFDNWYEGDSMRIPLKYLEREVCHGVPKVDL